MKKKEICTGTGSSLSGTYKSALFENTVLKFIWKFQKS